jgi:hypothetical protein
VTAIATAAANFRALEAEYLIDLVAGVGALVVSVIVLAIVGRALLLLLDLLLDGNNAHPRERKGD